VTDDFVFRSFGRNQRPETQLRKRCEAELRSTAKGRRPAGLTWSVWAGASTTAGVAQKAQREADTPGSKVVSAPHFVQRMLLRSAPHPRLRGALSASSSGLSTTSAEEVGSAVSLPQ
jgi:hypothetical protein